MAAVEKNVFDSGLLNAIADRLRDGDDGDARRLFTRAGGKAPTVIWNPDPEALPKDGLQFLLKHWRGMAGECSVPSVSALDPLDLRPVLGNVILIDVVDDGGDFRYRLYGTKIAHVSSADKTGCRMSEIDTLAAQFFYVVYRAVLLRPEPIYTYHHPTGTTNFRSWHRVILPLANASGEIVRFLVGCYPDPKSAELDDL